MKVDIALIESYSFSRAARSLGLEGLAAAARRSRVGVGNIPPSTSGAPSSSRGTGPALRSWALSRSADEGGSEP